MLSALLKFIPVGAPFADKMLDVLTRRINERRAMQLIALQYLHKKGKHNLHIAMQLVDSVDTAELASLTISGYVQLMLLLNQTRT